MRNCKAGGKGERSVGPVARRRLGAAGALVLCLLCACGAQDDAASRAGAPERLRANALTSAPAPAQADYGDLLQQFYLAYLGRPADPAGLAWFGDGLRAAAAPAAPGALRAAYNSNAAMRATADAIASSAEATSLYADDDARFVDAAYANLFNRAPEPAGRAYWTAALRNATLTRAAAALAIIDGAQGADAALLAVRGRAAAALSAALDTPAKRSAYDGVAANDIVRAMLATLTAASTAATIDGAVADAITALQAPRTAPPFGRISALITLRCVACHSVQPTQPGFPSAPLGIRFDTPEQIHADATPIYVNVVQTQFMPYGNQTGMSDAERALVADWYLAGAR